MRIKEEFAKKLLVEGNDDQRVVWALCERFEVAKNFDVIDCGGIDNLIDQIPVRIKSGITTMGIIVDADSNILSRWESLSLMLRSAGYETPSIFPEDGLILNNNETRIGIWIMPNNTLNGMLEDFMQFLVPEEDQLLEIANDCLSNIEDNLLNRYNTIHKSKALIHTWLAWQQDPGTPMGASITKRYLTTTAPICGVFINWLTRLYN